MSQDQTQGRVSQGRHTRGWLPRPSLRASRCSDGSTSPGQRAAVIALVFVSGACGLALQACWFREFRVFFGGSAAATAMVTAAFLAGLGLGNFVLGRRVDTGSTAARPLLFYALLELGLAIVAAASPWLIDAARAGFLSIGGTPALGPTLAWTMRLWLACIVLVVPTFLMGGTLPAAVRSVTPADDAARRLAGVLYGANTLGGVAGTLLTTFVLLDVLGTRGTLWLSCAGGLLTGLAALAVALRSPAVVSHRPDYAGLRPVHGPADDRTAPGVSVPGMSVRAIGAAAFLAGFVFFALEMVWYRMLGPILGGTTFTFGVILAVVLFGIAVGSVAYALCVRERPTVTLLAATFLAGAVAVAAPFALGDTLAVWAAYLREGYGSTFPGLVGGWFLVTALVVMPAALVAGFQFPAFAALLGAGSRAIGADIGFVFLANTLGCVAGALAGGFGLLPLLTATGAWRGAAIILAGTAACLALLSCMRLRGGTAPRLALAAPAVAVMFAVMACEGPTAVWRHGGIGGGRAPRLSDMAANELEHWKRFVRRTISWQTDGAEASLAISNFDGYAFLVNGRSDGHAIHDAGTQVMIGLLGAAIHPHPTSALVIGLGTGETAGWLAEVPSIERVDVVEIEPAVVEMAARCAAVNHDVLRHPKVRLLVLDAREVLLGGGGRYDLVVCEPSHPHRFGVASLFTADFYAAAAANLTDDGLLVQFLPCYEVDRGTVGSMAASFCSLFPHAQLWETQPGDLCLVGGRSATPSPRQIDPRRLHSHPFEKGLAAGWHVSDVEGLASRYVGGPAVVSALIATCGGEIATDDRNPIEFGFARLAGSTGLFDAVEIVDLAERASAGSDWIDAGADPARVAVTREWDLAASGRGGAPDEAGVPARIHDPVVQRFLAGDPAGMLEAWERSGGKARCLREASWIARRYAERGDLRCRPLIAEIRSVLPAEAMVLEAKFLLATGDRDAATTALAAAFSLLTADPWMSGGLRENAFQTAAELAADASSAASLLASLAEPFAADIARESRLTCGCMVAAKIGAEAARPYVAAYEPHVPWQRRFLDFRQRVYAETGDPRAAVAERERAAFERAETAAPPADAGDTAWRDDGDRPGAGPTTPRRRPSDRPNREGHGQPTTSADHVPSIRTAVLGSVRGARWSG